MNARAGDGQGQPALAADEVDLAVAPGLVGAPAYVVGGDRGRVGLVDREQVAGERVVAVAR